MSKERKVIFCDAYTDGIEIEGEVYYSRGGINYFNGGSDPRGYYFAVRPIRVHNGMRSFIMGSGTKKFLKAATRFNAKELERIMPDAESVEKLKQLGYAAAEKDKAILTR